MTACGNSQNITNESKVYSKSLHLSLGSVVEINENGLAVEFIVADFNYDGYVLLIRKVPIDLPIVFNPNDIYKYENSNIDKFLTNDYIKLLKTFNEDELVEVNIDVTCDLYGTDFKTKKIKRKCFILSYTELDFTKHGHAPIEGRVVEYFKNNNDDNRACPKFSYWTRTPYCGYSNAHWTVGTAGGAGMQDGTHTNYIRPAFCISRDNPILDNYYTADV